MHQTKQEPAVCDPRIGNALRQLREGVPMSGSQVAAATGWSESKVSRIERARIPVRLADIRSLLELYQVDEMSRGQLLDTAMSAGQNRDMDPLLRARHVRDWSPAVIPAPLRTSGYARAVLESFQPVTTILPSQITAILDDTAATQKRLTTGAPALQLHAVISEAALGNGFGTPAVMRSQLELLIQLAGLPSVDIAIIRTGMREGPRAIGPFSVLSFDPVLGYPTPDKAILFGLEPAQIDDEHVTWPLRVAFGLLREAADPDPVPILKRHYAKWGS